MPMAGSNDGDSLQDCKTCEAAAEAQPVRDGLERHSSFHDSLAGFLPTRPKPPQTKPKLRHRLVCKGKPRPHQSDKEFEIDSTHDFLNDKGAELPKDHAKPGAGDLRVSNFKSKAVYCEVKLTELLGKTGPRVRPITPGKYEDAPDSYRASVCCLLLGEISRMGTPYSRVLRTILDVLEQSIYSNYVTPHAGGTFDQVPYFELVGKLEAQHQRMLEEQERWKTMVNRHQATTDGIQQHMEELNDLLVKEKAKVAELQKDLLTAQRSLRKATKQVKELDHKVTQSRALVLQAAETKSKYEEEVGKYDNLYARYIDLTKEVQRLNLNLGVARLEAADGVPKEEFNRVENMVYELQSKLQMAEKFVRQAEAMTPRPNWAQLRGGPFFGMPSSQQASEIIEENKSLAKKNLELEAECAAVTVALVEATQPKEPAEDDKKKKGKDKGKK